MVRSSLSKYQPIAFDGEKLKREGWQEQGLLVVHENDERLDWTEKELIRRLGERLYGKGAKN